VEVPRIVTVNPCPVEAAMLPDLPPLAETLRCRQEFGDGSVCYDKVNAWRLAALLTALAETWHAVKACEEAQS